MFLELLRRRNEQLISTAVQLHQAGAIPANTYVIDLDAVTRNAGLIAAEANRLGLRTYAMTKQFGRNPAVAAAIHQAGVPAFVAVDTGDVRALAAANVPIGHIGHLVQIPTTETGAVAASRPEHWTVFNHERASQAGVAAKAVGYEQPLLARIVHERDRFYPGHEGGFPASDVLNTAQLLDGIDGAHFAGVTTFPALLFDRAAGKPRTTPNMQTLTEAAEALAREGRQDVQINAPGTTSVSTLSILADAGATQVEPGHALTGTTPWHAVEDLPELPAVAYLTEVSHHHAGRAYCFGGGLYVDPVLGEYPTHTGALTGRNAGDLNPVQAELPPATAIDYYAQLEASNGRISAVGDSVVFGFRVQAFVTRAYVAPIRGISTGSAEVAGLWYTNGLAAGWPSL